MAIYCLQIYCLQIYRTQFYCTQLLLNPVLLNPILRLRVLLIENSFPTLAMVIEKTAGPLCGERTNIVWLALRFIAKKRPNRALLTFFYRVFDAVFNAVSAFIVDLLLLCARSRR